AASRGLPPEVVMEFNQRRVAPTAGSFGIALETGDMVEIPHARTDPRVLHEVGAIPEELTNVPLKTASGIVGILAIDALPRSDQERRLLWALADLAAAAIEKAQLYEAEQGRRREAETLRQAALALGATLDLQQVFELILSELQRVVPYDSASVQLLKEDRLEIIGGHGFPNLGDLLGISFPVDGDNPNRHVVATRAPYIVDDAPAVYAAFRQEPHAPAGTRAWLGVPLLFGDRLIGMIALDKRVPAFYTPEHARLALAFATQAAIAIRNAQLLEASRQRAQEIETLAEVGHTISSTLDLGQVLETIVARATILCHSEEGGIFELDEAEGVLRITASYNASQEFVRAVNEARLRVGEGAIGRAAATRAPAQVLDTETEAGYRFREIAAIDGIRSALAAPMLRGGEMLGGIVLWRKRPGAFSPQDVALLTAVADQAAMAVKNARLYAQMREKAEDLSFLLDTSLILGSSLDLGVVLQGLVERITGSLAVTLSRIALLDEAGENLVVRATHAMHSLKLETTTGGIIPLAAAPCHREVVQSGKPLLIYQQPRTPGSCTSVMSEAELERTLVRGLSSAYLVPLKRGERVLGVLSLGETRNAERAPFTPEKMGLCLAVASYAARAVENAQLFEALARSHEELQSAQAQLVQAVKMTAVGELAAGVAHEINNPLTVILGYLQLLTAELEADPEKRERLVAMEQAGRRISRMVRGLLDFSRREDYRFLPTDVNATIESILALIAPQIERGGGIRLVKEFAPGLAPVSASARHLEQVWMNLLLNARDAVAGSPQGEIRVATRFDRGAGQVQVVVSDNGVGIPKENLGRLFQPFFTTKPPGQGTGLGLRIVQGILERHRGSIRVESKVGEGTAFTVSLPATQVAGSR
ncbi:MAG: GAF domain-containing protein, partial [Chloroflexota bacterium]